MEFGNQVPVGEATQRHIAGTRASPKTQSFRLDA